MTHYVGGRALYFILKNCFTI